MLCMEHIKRETKKFDVYRDAVVIVMSIAKWQRKTSREKECLQIVSVQCKNVV